MTARGALEVAALAARHFERLGIPDVVVGSVASAFHGEPRATLDDREYLDTWGAKLGVTDLLARSLRDTGLQ